MSHTTIIITLVSVLVGYIGNAVQSGSILGLATVPRSWIPYLTILGTFLASAIASLSQAASVNSAAWFTALIAGLTSLLGSTAGITVHQHLSLKKTPAVPPPTP